MLKYGDKDLRKRWKGTVNSNTIYLGTTKIWPYITNVAYGNWVINLSTSQIPASGGTITVTSVSRTVTKTWVNFVGTTNTRYTTNETEYMESFTVSSSIGSVNGNVITIPYNPNTSDRNIVVSVTSPTGGQAQTNVTQLKNVITYSAWDLTLSVSPTSIANTGGTATITSNCSRTYTNSNGQPDGTETSVVSLSTNVGSISNNTLTIPANNDTSAKTVTVTATAQGLTKTVNLTQAAAETVTTKYYAVTTDAYQVKANGVTKDVPNLGNSSPTNSYHYGTIVFAIDDGPSTITAEFISKDYQIGTSGGVTKTMPFGHSLRGLEKSTFRVLSIGSSKVNRKLMTVPSAVTLTAYNSESQAIANAVQKLCTITDTGYVPEAVKPYLTCDSEYATITKVSEEVTSEAYYIVNDISFPFRTQQYVFTTKTNISIATFTFNKQSYNPNNDYDRFGFLDITDYTSYTNGGTKLRRTVSVFTAAPSSSITIEDCQSSLDAGDNYFYGEGVEFVVNDSNGNKVKIGDGKSYGTTLYIYEWLWDTSTWIKIGQVVLEQGAVQAFIYRHGEANSLTRKLYHKAEA